MSITILQRSSSGMRSVKLKSRYLYTVISLFVLLPTTAAIGGYMLAMEHSDAAQVRESTIESWKDELAQQKKSIEKAKTSSQQQIDALTAKLGMMQAHIRRLDAAGERIVTVSGLDAKEFNFSEAPAVGGPEKSDTSKSMTTDEIIAALENLNDDLESREQKLTVLESLLMDKHMGVERFISGRPIEKGWLSSYYGERSDPFTGKAAWHGGIDFAGKEDSAVLSTAAGVVSWVGERHGYGLLVEINHGDGYVTRYAHNKAALVKKGDIVKKGHKIAKMGNTGRSTGAHVHYEVIKDGRTINPLTYVNRVAKKS
ncbi:MAG: M23 family metallopeptidase [Gammaproteobacteria bacterium]|nr:M23 family metallopeptidase [Gammaproteobacteria bacterium]